jgi:hypothetical protein
VCNTQLAEVRDLPVSEYIAPLCAAQMNGQAFFCIPDRPSEVHARERSTTAIVTIVKGVVTARQVEEEFARIHPKTWRWIAHRVADNMFTVRFSNAQIIAEWECFNPISMRNVRAKLKVEPWSGAVGAKAELEQAWFRIRGIPYDKEEHPHFGLCRLFDKSYKGDR